MRNSGIFVAVIISIFSSFLLGAGGVLPGDGSEATPYLIQDLPDFQVYIDPANSATYWAAGVSTSLETDLDLSAEGVYTAGLIGPGTGNQYLGYFNGNSKVISNVTIAGPSSLGLFGYIGEGAEVSGLGLDAISITSPGGTIGILCGTNNGLISECYAVNSSISGYNTLGGLCGYNYEGDIIKSYAYNVDVTGRSNIGGLCGYNHRYSNIDNCYAVGSITGSTEVGGLCGYLYDHSNITNCYSGSVVTGGVNTGGLVGYVNYFCSLTNGFFYSYGGRNNGNGTALNTDQMQEATYFSGFDFVGNTLDGDNEIWDITAGHFPKLYYQTDDGASLSNIITSTTLAGSGTISDPFLIGSYDDMMELSGNVGLRNGCFKLTVDIDMQGLVITEALVDQVFKGLFDGDGHTISNFSIVGGSNLGLFTRNDGTITDLGITSVVITGSGNTIGALCGTNYYGVVSECYVTNSNVSGYDNVGGLCGYSYSGSIIKSFAYNVDVIGRNNVGGLCGYDRSYSNIENCYAVGTISGSTRVGGLSGYHHDHSNIINCYSGSIVNGDTQTGGLIGFHEYYTAVTNTYFYAYGGRNNGYGTALNIEHLQDATYFAGFDFVGNTLDGDNEIWDITAGHFPKLYYQTDDGASLSNLTATTTLAGSGTNNDPYLISSYDDMMELSGNVGLRNGCYKLTTDIDMQGLVITEALVNQAFIGVFDGNGHTISNFSIVGGSNIGLFSRNDGTITDLGITSVVITGSGNTIGALCGTNYYGVVSECYVTNSNVSGYDNVGGLCGYSYSGSIIKSFAFNVDVIGRNNVGGLCGYDRSYSNIENCYAVGTISGSTRVGGLSGYHHDHSNIINCYSGSIVNGDTQTGGLIGFHEYYTAVTNTYFYAYGSRNNGYGTALNIEHLQDATYFAGFDFVGNILDGDNEIWDITAGHFPKLYYQTDDGASLSNLTATTTLAGSGTNNDPYLVSSYGDMMEFSSNAGLRTGCYKLTKDIDMQELEITEALINQTFLGSFDGDGHTISNFSIVGGSNLGLFIRNDGTITDLGIDSVEITSSGSTVGVLCGTNYYGLISECFVTNSIISGFDNLGGLCGYSYSSNIIKSFTYNVNITGRNNVGGLCGYNRAYSIIENCYAVGTINGSTKVGGLCGYLHDHSNLVNCYSASTVSGSSSTGGLLGLSEYYTSITSSYWDVETDGIDENSSGDNYYGSIGKTTAELQTVDTFEGWNFIDNGELVIWFMFANEYPRLRWEVSLVPDVTNIPQTNAEDAIADVRLTIGEVTNEYSFTIVEDNIISQDIAAGEYVLRYTPIDLAVSDGPEMAIVPDVIDTPLADAETAITDVKLIVGEITHAYDFVIPAGNVIRQSIAGGESIIINNEIDLVISDGPEMTTVPDVVYMTEEDAVHELMTAKLAVGTITHVYDFDVPSGQVIRQFLTAGEPAIINTEVDIEVSDGPEMIGVPSLYDMNLTEAIGIIENAGLTVGDISYGYSFTVAQGNITGQSIAGGGTTVIGSAINLAVSDGPQIVTVPDVVGMDQVSAEAAIASAKLTVGTPTLHYSATVTEGYVISQSVPGNDRALIGSLVSLVISKGPKMTTVPAVTDLPQAHAEAIIAAADLTVGTVTTISSMTVPAGNIISQNLTAGDSVTVDTSINLEVSSGLPMVTVPDLINLSEADATIALTDANLTVGTKAYGNSSTVPAGSVISQSVAADETVQINSVIDLVISEGPVMVTVPSLRNKTQSEAEASLSSAGLMLGSISYDMSYTVLQDGIISQTAAAGELVAVDSAIDIVLSSGLSPVNMETFAQLAGFWLAGDCNTQAGCLDIDFNYDNNIDMIDMTLLTNNWLSASGIAVESVIAEYFEGLNHLIYLGAAGESNWSIVSDEVYQGKYSARSAAITDKQESIMEVTIDTSGFDTISFACKVSSEQDYDYLKFYIDGKRQDMFSGEIDWTMYSYSVLPGAHTFRWVYEKDETISEGEDFAWIDSIVISQNEDVE